MLASNTGVKCLLNEIMKPAAHEPTFLTDTALSLICFGGKGGVGKTTSAAATALYLAEKNPRKRILLASVDPAHSLADSLMDTSTSKNLTVWEIDARASLQKFMDKHGNTIKIIIGRGTFLDKSDISGMLSVSLPGIDELMGMIELVELLENKTHDVIVLDTAPTGHTIKFLQMPQLIKKWTRLLDLMMEKHRCMSKLYTRHYQPDGTDAFIAAFSNGAKKVERILRKKSCEFVPVMQPEALSVSETKRFISVLENHGIPIKNIIVNRVHPNGTCSFCNRQYLNQRKYVNEIERCYDGCHVLLMQRYAHEIHGREALLMFAQDMKNNKDVNRDNKANGKLSSPSHRMVVAESGEAGVMEPASFSVSPLLRFSPEESVHSENTAAFRYFPVPKPDLEFLLFGGKGGVGKTTVAAATALMLSGLYPKKRILLFSTDPAHSLSDSLGVAVGEDGLALRNNLFVREMNAEKEYERLKALYSRELKSLIAAFTESDAAITVVFEKEIMESFIDMTPPGIDEVMAITTIIDYVEKEKYDLFILDTAPTGHLLRFLEMPELALDWLKLFFNLFIKYKNTFRMPKLSAFMVDLSKKIKHFLNLLRNGKKSLFIPIAIPAEMAYEETSDLVQAVRNLKIPVSQLLLNMVHPCHRADFAAGDCALCDNISAYERSVANNFNRLFPDKTPYVIYRQEQEVCGIEALKKFSGELYGYR